jgi:alpha-beta hydrolase superfamily lysophospholipase
MATMSTYTPDEERVETAAGFHIVIRSWHPRSRPRGVVAIVHGVKSHGGYFGWAAEQLVNDGLAVYALDLHGRGKSDGDRLYLERIEDYLSDVEALVGLAKAREPGLPVFLLGHSAGGVISCVYTLEHQAELAGLVCESFAFQVAAPDAILPLLKAIGRIAPHLPVLKLKNRDFSRDPEAVRAMESDPLVANEVQPSHTVAELVRATERLRKEFPRITLPVLILHGTSDRVTRPSGSQFFYERAGSRDKTLKLYEGHAHDLLNDLDRQVVMADIQGWMNAHLPAA